MKLQCGYDGLSKKILKLCGSQISKLITYIYNNSLNCGICPNHPKYAIIKLCFKKMINHKYQIMDLSLY